jgi:hypothetical protein
MGAVSLFEDMIDRLYDDLAAAGDDEGVYTETARLARRVPMRDSERPSRGNEDVAILSPREQFRNVMWWALHKAKSLESANDQLRKDNAKLADETSKQRKLAAQLRGENASLRRKLAKIRQTLDG